MYKDNLPHFLLCYNSISKRVAYYFKQTRFKLISIKFYVIRCFLQEFPINPINLMYYLFNRL